MKITIITIDNAVYVDGVCKMPLDLSSCGIPSNVWALQWKDTSGWLEFNDNDDGTKPANEPIVDLPMWASACVTAWNDFIVPVPVEEVVKPQPITNGTQEL